MNTFASPLSSTHRRVVGLFTAVLSLALLLAASQIGERNADAAGFASGMVSLTFDDGWATQYTNARPEMLSRGLTGTYYSVSQELQQNWAGYMTVAQLKQIQADGNEIASHTVDHKDLTTLTQAQRQAELRDSKAYLEATFGVTVPHFASPYGAFNADVMSDIRAEYRSHRTVTPGLIANNSYVDQLPSYDIHQGITFASVNAIVDQAIANKNWAILTFHEIVPSGASTGTQLNRADFTAILDYLKSTGVRVVTVANGVSQMTGATTPPEVGTTIYDEALRNGYANWSWAVHNLANTTTAHSGTSSISFEPDNYSGLLFHTSPISAAKYEGLEFWANGGSTGGQNVQRSQPGKRRRSRLSKRSRGEWIVT